jgi:N-acetyl-1-D-myo-inositol-2-amino-2-deoxy-alpha-D-glucopyranoside deacetylase
MVRAVVEETAADVVVTYEEHGGYGHPDHVQAHRVTCAAVASMPERRRPDLYAVVTPRSWAVADRAWLAEALGATGPWTVPAPADPFPPSVVEDGWVSHEVRDPALVPLQEEALRAHRTQVSVGDGCYALSNDIAARLPGREGYACLDPATGALVGRADAGRGAALASGDPATGRPPLMPGAGR